MQNKYTSADLLCLKKLNNLRFKGNVLLTWCVVNFIINVSTLIFFLIFIS